MEEKEDGCRWARFNALLEVAEEERAKYEKEKKDSGEKERNLRRNLGIISKFLFKIEKENSLMNESRRAAQNFEISTYQKGKRSDRKKISSADTHKKRVALPNSGGDHQQKDKSDPSNSLEKSSDTGEEEMPRPEKAKKMNVEVEPIMAIPEAFYFEGQYQGMDANFLFTCKDIFKNSSKRLRGKGKAEMPKPKKAKKVDHDEVPVVVQPLPETFKNKIRALGGSESTITLVFQKVLTAADVSRHQSRLLIPFKQVKDHSFLTAQERDMLGKRYLNEEEGNDEMVKIPALLIDPKGKEHQMNFTRWDMRKDVNKVSSNYSLLTRWTQVVRNNELKTGDFVQLWAFRKGSDLGFALVS